MWIHLGGVALAVGLPALDDLEAREAVAIPQRGAELAARPPRRVPRGLLGRAAPASGVDEPRTPGQLEDGGRGGVAGVPAPRRVVLVAVHTDRFVAGEETRAVKRVDRHVEDERVRHRVAETAEVWRLEEGRGQDPESAELPDLTAVREQVRVVATVLADHEQPVVRLCRGDHLQRFGERGGQRLLAEDRQPAAERLHRHRVVGIGHGHVDHGVGTNLVDELVQGSRDRHSGDAQLLQRRLRRGDVEVGDAGQFHLVAVLDVAQPAAAHRTGADLQDAQGPVDRRPGRLGRRLGAHRSSSAFSGRSSYQPAGLFRSRGTSREPTAGAAQSTALAMTVRTSGWW